MPYNGWRAASAVIVLSGLLSGCAGADVAPSAQVAAALPTPPPAYTARPEDEPALIDNNWLHSFHDATLNALVDEALENNRTLLGAAARRKEAEARARKAGANLLPTADILAGSSHSGPVQGSGAANQFELGLKVSWELDLWGRLANTDKAAALDLVSARADYRFARISLAAQIANSWFVTIGNKRQITLDQEALSAEIRTLDVVNARVEAGQVLSVDGSTARADVASAQERLAASQGALEDAVRSLEILLGRYPSSELATPGALPVVPGPTPAGLPSELLERRPDVVAKDRAVAAAFNRTEATKAARLPTLSLTGTFGGASANLGDVLNPSSLAWSILGNLLAPVFDGGRRKADVEISTAQQEQALQDYAQTALQAFGDVESALANEQVLQEREKRLITVVAELQNAVAVTDVRYEAGLIDYLSVNQVRQQLNAARDSLLKIRVERLKQRVNLHLALGGSFVAVEADQSGKLAPATMPEPVHQSAPSRVTPPTAKAPPAPQPANNSNLKSIWRNLWN